MASNVLPDRLNELFTLAEDMADGLAHNAADAQPIDIKQNTETVLRAALTAAQAAQNSFETARAHKKNLNTAVNLADSNAKAFIATARNVLRVELGNEWSESWLPTGFPNQSLAVPETIAERQALLQSLQTFLSDPAVENAPLNITGTRAGELFVALSSARSVLNAHLTALGQKKTTRDSAVIALRKRMSGLVDELGQLIPADDPRWYGFGLNPPAAPDTPDAPDTPVLTSSDPGTLVADWGDVPRATRYRVWRQIVGTDTEFVSSSTVLDSDTSLSGLPSGATVRVRVSAANDAGESQPGPAAEIVVE